MDELLPIVDEEGRTIGSALREECHDGKSMKLHPVVHLHIFRPDGSIMLQKRSQTKQIQPGKWDTCVGGHISFGETPEEALCREASEEVGVDASNAQSFARYLFQSEVERELVNVYLLRVDEKFNISVCNDEVDEVRFFPFDEICGEDFTPNLLWEVVNILKQQFDD